MLFWPKIHQADDEITSLGTIIMGVTLLLIAVMVLKKTISSSQESISSYAVTRVSANQVAQMSSHEAFHVSANRISQIRIIQIEYFSFPEIPIRLSFFAFLTSNVKGWFLYPISLPASVRLSVRKLYLICTITDLSWNHQICTKYVSWDTLGWYWK